LSDSTGATEPKPRRLASGDPDGSQVNRCETCASPLVAQADALVVADASIASIARRLGLSKQSLARHVRNGHVAPRPPAEPARPADEPEAGEAPERSLAEELKAQLRDLNAIDAAKLSASARIDLFESRRRTVESLARVEPPRPATSVGWREVQGVPEMLAVLVGVVDRHPDVRDELAAAMGAAGLAEMMEAGG
jgi:transposase-like protein